MCQQTVLFWFFSALKSERDILKVFKVITKITIGAEGELKDAISKLDQKEIDK